MLLQHIHFPSATPILYTHALHIQEIFARQHLKHKALISSTNRTKPSQSASPATPSPSPSPPKPKPKLITFSAQPTYTTGLRDSRHLTPHQISTLTSTGAAHHASPRGGLTTYHGPGQLTAFLITSLAYHALSPRCYVHFFEDSVIQTCAGYGVQASRWSPGMGGLNDGLPDESRPGVWTGANSKICSLGIHFRRGVSSFGLGFNVTDEVGPWFDRIVACGIPESKAVSLAAEMMRLGVNGDGPVGGVDGVAGSLAAIIAANLSGVDGVESIDVRALGDVE